MQRRQIFKCHINKKDGTTLYRNASPATDENSSKSVPFFVIVVSHFSLDQSVVHLMSS
jgi:hypothetical protein